MYSGGRDVNSLLAGVAIEELKKLMLALLAISSNTVE